MRLSIDLLPMAETFSSFGAVNELALVAIVLVTLAAGSGTVLSMLLRRRPAVRHTVLLGSLVLSAFFPISIFLGQNAGPFSLAQIDWQNQQSSFSGQTSWTNHRQLTALDVATNAESTREPKALAAVESLGFEALPQEAPDPFTQKAAAVTFDGHPISAEAVDAHNLSASATEFAHSWSTPWWMIYFVVVAGLLFRNAISLVRLFKLKREATQACEEILQMACRIADSLDLSKAPTVLLSSRVGVPISIAGRNQAVVLPRNLARLFPEQADVIDNVLRHEIAHLKRNDQRTIAFQIVLRIIYWPIPTIHLASAALSRSREEICDHIAAGEDIVGYGRTLLTVAEEVVNGNLSHPVLSAGFGRGAAELKRRVASLLAPAIDRRSESSSRCRYAVAIAVASMAILVGSFRLTSAKAQAADESIAATTVSLESLEPLDVESLVPATKQAREASAIPFYRRSLSPAIYTGQRLAVPAAATPQFTGNVIDSKGDPIANVKIYAVSLSLLNQPLGPNGVTSTRFRYPKPLVPDQVSIGPVRAETKADGSFAFDAGDLMVIAGDGQPAFPPLRLFATAEHYGPDSVRLRGGNSVKATPVTLQLQRDDVPIQGQLLDSNGSPLRGAEVQLERIEIPREFSEHLDRLRTAMPSDSGPSPRSIVSLNWDVPGLTKRTLTDRNGRFTFTGVGRDRFVSLYASGEGFARTRLARISRKREDWPMISEKYQARLRQYQKVQEQSDTAWPFAPRAQNLSADYGQWKMKASPIVSGQVVDRETGRGVSGMLLAAQASRGPDEKHASLRSRVGVIHARSGEHGRFRFTVPHGLYTEATDLSISTQPDRGGTHFGSTLYLPIPDSQQPDQIPGISDIKLKADRGISYTVHVKNDAGQPITDVEIFASSLPASRSDDEARRTKLTKQTLLASEIEPGVYRGLMFSRRSLIFVNAPDLENYRSAYLDPSLPYVDGDRVKTATSSRPFRNYDAIVPAFNEHSDETTKSNEFELSVKLQRQSPLMLRLVNRDGKLVRNVTTRGFDLSSARSDPIVRDGTITVHALHPKRKHTFRFRNEELDLIGQVTVDGSMEGRIDVLMQSPVRVEGRLVNEDQSIHTGSAKISLRTVAAEETDSAWTLDAYTKVTGGKFTFEGLVPGHRYRVLGVKGELFDFDDEFIIEPGQTKMLGDITWKPNKSRR